MGKAKKAQMKEIALMEQDKALAEAGVTQTNKVVYPPYFAKRKHLLNAGLIKLLQETADREPEVVDVFGEYKQGTFLHRYCIVTVTRENELWMVHIYSGDNPITLPIIQEVRDKYIPNYCMMVQFYPSREERNTLKGIQLCEMPGSIQEDVPEENKQEEKE